MFISISEDEIEAKLDVVVMMMMVVVVDAEDALRKKPRE